MRSSGKGTRPAPGDVVGQLRVSAVTALPERLAVGGGTAIFVDGRCTFPGAQIEHLAVVFDGTELSLMGWGMPPPERTEGDDYWWTIIPIRPMGAPRLAWIELRALLADGRAAAGRLGAIELVEELATQEPERTPRSAAAAAGRGGERSVAICMATWEPPAGLFERQIESIRRQANDEWICLISDDASSPSGLERIRRAIDGDPRFALSVSGSRQGFYRNFERALAMVPDDVRFVALCDQDDRWEERKLTRLIEAMQGGVRLAYSDMRVIEESGEVRSDTYWSIRPNNHTDLASLVFANTVTGAASLFERSLLVDVLPFPPPLGNAYHDHWIAQVALALGELAYVDEPLYDYVQHRSATLGHDAANSPRRRRASLPELVRRLREDGFHPGWRGYYFNLYCRTAITTSVLRMRCGSRMSDERIRALERTAPSSANVPWLLARSARGSGETLGREGAMLRGLAWRELSEARRRLRARSARRARSSAVPSTFRSALDGGLRPILLDYFTRDGSTLTMRLLGSSPQVLVEDVYPFERKYFAYFWAWAHLLDRGSWDEDAWGPRSLGSLDDLRASALIGPPPWQPRPLLDPGPGEPELSRRCFELVWAEFSRRARAGAVAGGSAEPLYSAEKHLNTWLVAREQLPKHELIVLLRDPRDTWASIRAFEGNETFGGEDRATEERLLEHVISRQRQRLRWVGTLLEAGDVPVIRYEDLIGDLDGVAALLGEHLGVELDAAAVRDDAGIRRRHVSAASPAASVGRWRSELPAGIAATFATELGEELRELGFEV